MPSNIQRSYIGLQGVAAGPIKIGPSGPWIQGKEDSAVYQNVPFIEVQYDLSGLVLAPIRAGYPSSNDDNSVVTVKYLKDNYESKYGSNAIPDLSKYVEQGQLTLLQEEVNAISLKADTAYSTSETTKKDIDTLNIQLDAIAATTSENQQEILQLIGRLNDLVNNPFESAVLLVAGNAWGEV